MRSLLKMPSYWVSNDSKLNKHLGAIDPETTVVLHSNSCQSVASEIPGLKIEVPSSTFELAKDILLRTNDLSIKTVIAIGGGKTIDIAKLCFFTNIKERLELDASENISAIKQDLTGKKSATLIVCPSIPGAGSEASKVAVISEKKCKYPLAFDSFFADQIIYIDELYQSLNRNQIMIGLFDVLSHLSEGYLSPIGPFDLKQYAKMGFQAIVRVIKDVHTDKTFDFKEIMVLSSLAGYIQSFTSVGLIHGISHTLEGEGYGGHAFLNACYFASVMDFNAKKSPKVGELTAVLGLSVNEFLTEIEKITNAFNIEKPIVKDISEVSLLIAKDVCTRTNVRLARKSDIESLLQTS